MRGKKKMRYLAMFMAVVMGVTSLSDSVLAAFNSTAEEANAKDTLKKLEEGQEIDAQEAKYILESLGIFNEDGSMNTSKIIMDQREYSLEEIKEYLQGGTADLDKKVSVDGTELTLGNVQTMLQIEEELSNYQTTYFPENTGEYTPEMEATISSLLMQLNEGKLTIKAKNAANVINRDVTLSVDELAEAPAGEEITVNVTISEAVTHTIFVEYRTMDGVAKDGTDYEGKKGVLRIPAGETTASVAIPTKNSIEENDESTWWNGNKLFYVEFTNVTGAVFTDGGSFQYSKAGIQGNLADLDGSPWETTSGSLPNPAYDPTTTTEPENFYFYSFSVPQSYVKVIDFLTADLDSDDGNGVGVFYDLRTLSEDGQSLSDKWGSIGAYPEYQSGNLVYNIDLSENSTGFPAFVKNEGYKKTIAALPMTRYSALYSLKPMCKPVTGTTVTLKPVETDQTYYEDSMIPCVLQTNGNVSLGGPVSIFEDGVLSTDDGRRFGDTFSCLLTKDQYEAVKSMCSENESTYPNFNRADYSWSQEPNMGVMDMGKGTVQFEGFDTANNKFITDGPKYVQEYIKGITVDKQSYDPGTEGDQTVTVTVTYDNQTPNDDWLWNDYANDYNKEGKESVDRLKVSLDGGATLYQLSPELDEKGDPKKNGRLTAQIPLPYNTQTEERTYRAELFLMPAAADVTVPQVTGVKSDYACLVGANHMAEFKVKPVNLIQEGELELQNLPDGNILYMVQEEACTLGCSITTENPTFPGIEWTSSNEDVALINRMTGVITPKAEGEVQFTATAYNRKAAAAVSVQTPVITVVNDGPPAIAVPKGMDIVHARKKGKASVYWMSNLNGKGNDQVYTVDLYEGDYTDKEKELPAEDKIIKTYEFTETVTGEIEENILTKVSKDGLPVYTFVVHTPNPDNPQIELSARGGIIVSPVPASVRLTTPEKLYMVDSETDSFPVSWSLSDTEEDYEFQLSVKKNGDEIYNTTEGTSAAFSVDKVDEGTLKDVYTVTAKVRNKGTEDKLWSTDSYLVQVYREGAFAFDVDGEREENGASIAIANEERIPTLKNYNGSWSDEDSQAIVDMNRRISLDKSVKIFDSSSWNMAADRFAWSSDDGSVMPLYRKDSTGYTNIEKLASPYQAPDQVFMMSGKKDGTATVKAVHSRTGKEMSLTAEISTLKDKLYLFQFTPMQETTITYERRDGKEVSIRTNEQGQAAIYDPDGIENAVQARSGSEDTTLYLGTVQPDVLVSSEKDKGRDELYPVNYITLDEAAHVKLYLKDEKGDPYKGKVSYTGGAYKNQKYCPLVQKGSMDNRLEMNLGQDGELEFYYDVTRLYSEDEDAHTQLHAGDYLEFVYDIRTPDDAYYPRLITVDSYSQERGASFTDSIVNLEKNTDTEKKVYISAQKVGYPNKGDLDILGRKEPIGCTNQYPKISLKTEMLCWGLDTDSDFQCFLTDEEQKKLGRQEFKVKKYPFTDLMTASNEVPVDENTGIDKGSSRRFTSQLYENGEMVRSIPLPFPVTNMIGIEVTEEKQFKPFTVDVNLKQTTAGDAASQGGEVGSRGLQKFNTGVDTPFFKVTVTPTVDPFVFHAFAGYDMDLLGMDTDMVMNPIDCDTTGANASAFVAAVTGKEKNLSGRFQGKMNKTLKKPGDTDFGGRAAGYMAGDIIFNIETGAFEFVITDSGFTLGGKFGYHWTFNSVVGIVPITAEFALGAAMELDYKAMAAYSQETNKFGSDILTTLRVNAYMRAFAGFGFDVAILALKIGMFGQINLEHYSQFLSRTYQKSDKQIQGHRTELSGVIGIEFMLKVFFFKYRKVLASTNMPTLTFYNGNWDAIQQWIAQADIPDWGGNVSPNAMLLSENGGLAEVDNAIFAEDRSYLQRAAAFSLEDDHTALDTLLAPAYPYGYPQVTRDGGITVALSDQNSADLNQTRVYWSQGSNAPSQAIPVDWTGEETPDSNVSLAGTGSFAVAAWEKLRSPVSMDQQGEYSNAEASVGMSQMMNDSEVVASIYEGGAWNSVRLTDNKNADMAPQAASNGEDAVVIYRSMAGSSLDDPLDNDVMDELWYSRYSKGKWSEPTPIYRETNGSISALEAVMDENGHTGIAFTVKREDASSEEEISDTFFMALKADDTVTDPIRLTLGEGTNENAKITAANVDGRSQFIAAWYQNQYDADLDSTVGDICFKILDSDGVVKTDFPDSLSEMNTNSSAAIGSRFEFVKSAGESLEHTGIAWTASDMTPKEDSSQETEKDLLYVSMFKDTDKGIVMTPGTVAADPGDYTSIDSFSVWSQDEKTLNSMLLGTYYDSSNASLATIYEGQPVNIAEDTSILMSGSASLNNKMEVDHVSYENEALQKGGLLPLSFYVVNQGYETVNRIKIISGDTVLADEEVSLLPGRDMMVSGNYPIPNEEDKNITNVEYTVSASFENGEENTEGTIVLDTPDAGISLKEVNILKEQDEIREFQMQFYNDSVNDLSKTGYKVKLGFYKSSGGEVAADVKLLSDTRETQEPIGTGVYQLSQEQVQMLDKDSLSMNFAYELTDADTLPMNLYAKLWIEDGDGNKVMDSNVLNNDKMIRFQDLMAKNNGKQFLTENQVSVKSNSTEATVTVKILSRTTAENVNVLVGLYSASGKLLDTKYLAVNQDELMNLGAEGTESRQLTFDQPGNYVRSTVLMQNFDRADASLKSLGAEQVKFTADFDPDTLDYEGDGENLTGTVITAASSHPEAAVTINGETTVNGTLQVPLSYGENVITIEVRSAEEGMETRTYTLKINNKEVKENNYLTLVRADQEPESDWYGTPVSYSINLPENVEDAGFASFRFTTDNGTTWSEENVWEQGKENLVEIAQEGIYDNGIAVRLFREDGSYLESNPISVNIDMTPPVVTGITYEKLDEEGNVIPGEEADGNWKGNLRILVHTTDALSGIGKVNAVMESEPGTGYTAEAGEEGIYTFEVSPSYRGNILITSEDKVGKSVRNTIRVNVDDKVPAGMLFETQVSKTDPTAEPVTVSIKTIHPDMVSDSIEYSVGDEEHWQQYSEPFAVEENTIIYYRAQDTSGNMTEVQTLTISNIDKNPPILKLNLTGDAEGWNAGDVGVTVANEGKILGEPAFYYCEKGKEDQESKWRKIEADEDGKYGVVFTEEGEHTWIFKAVSPAGTESKYVESVIRIDRTLPTGSLKIGTESWDSLQSRSSKTIKRGSDPSMRITSDDEPSGVRSVEYAVSTQRITEISKMGEEELTWKTYRSAVKVPLNKKGVTIVYARITDMAGNTTYLSSDDYKYEESKTIISQIKDMLTGSVATGDNTPIVLFIILLLAAAAALVTLFVKRQKREKK